MLEQLTQSPIPEALLLLGSVTAILISVKGGSKEKGLGVSLTGLGFIVSILMLTSGLRSLFGGGPPGQVILLLMLLGIGLFFKVFHRVPIAAIVSFILATVAFAIIGIFVPDVVEMLLGAGIVFLVSLLLVGSVEAVADTIGRFFGWRPVLLILGVSAIVVLIKLYV